MNTRKHSRSAFADRSTERRARFALACAKECGLPEVRVIAGRLLERERLEPTVTAAWSRNVASWAEQLAEYRGEL